MNLFSLFLHQEQIIRQVVSRVVFVVVAVAVSACYSFRGGSVPEHLQTVSISSVIDRSGFGDASLREYCTETILRRFRTDNTLQLVEDNGHVRLTPSIVRIQDQILNVQNGDLENQRKMVVAVEVEYVDAVKNRVVWKRTFENFGVYNVDNATEERQNAARSALDRITDDILLAVVSDW